VNKGKECKKEEEKIPSTLTVEFRILSTINGNISDDNIEQLSHKCMVAFVCLSKQDKLWRES